MNFIACIMRIIGGRFKGRRFHPPAKHWPTRPTTDFAKEGLFNILHNKLDFGEIVMLDLFGGSGNHTYEAVSHGCTDVTYVEQHYPCVKFVKEVCHILEIESSVRIVKSDVAKFLKRTHRSYDYIFAGPPYALPWLDAIPTLVFDQEMLSDHGILVLEHNRRHDFTTHPFFDQVRSYGGTHFSFFNAKSVIAD